MSFTDSMSLSASLNELPNLPGVRRNPAQTNPKLYKQYMSLKKEASVDSLQCSQSLTHFDDPEYFSALSATLKPYPSSGTSFNDIGGRYSLRSQQRDRECKTKALPYSNIENAPSFVTNKEQICSFTASFEDSVPENLVENRRVRIVEIIVRTVDNTIEIREPVIPNSGLMQGKLLRRHQIQKPTSTPDAPEYYTLADFYAGAVVTIYNRDYTILDCTSFTRQYLANKGLDFGCAIRKPNSTDSRQGGRSGSPNRNSSELYSPPRACTAETRSFYEYDKLVLRFYGVWYGKEDPVPVKYRVRIHYYLADDKIEIISQYSRNDGRDRFPKFLRKTRIEKPADSMLPSENSQFSSSFFDANNESTSSYYHWSDLVIGSYLHAVGVSIQILDMDPFTRHFLEENGVCAGEPIVLSEEIASRTTVVVPPHNGFGSEEDSLQTCGSSLMPKPPKKDGVKANLYAGISLRFRIKFRNAKPADAAREFVLQVFMEDDTIQIREISVRNSGFTGGKFLARTKQKHRDGTPILPSHIYLGAVLYIQHHEFEVVDADEATLKLMERYSEFWHQSSMKHLAEKLKQYDDGLQDVLVLMKEKALQEVPYGVIEEHLAKAGVVLTKQELVSLFRLIDKKKLGTAKFFRIFKLIKDEETMSTWSKYPTEDALASQKFD